MEQLLLGISNLNYQQVIMYFIGVGLIYLAIKKEYEPMLLLPIGFGPCRSFPFSCKQKPCRDTQHGVFILLRRGADARVKVRRRFPSDCRRCRIKGLFHFSPQGDHSDAHGALPMRFPRIYRRPSRDTRDSSCEPAPAL